MKFQLGLFQMVGQFLGLFNFILNGLDARYLHCYIIHDYLYSNILKYIRRIDADRLLYEMLVDAGMQERLAKIVYKSVRMFGRQSL